MTEDHNDIIYPAEPHAVGGDTSEPPQHHYCIYCGTITHRTIGKEYVCSKCSSKVLVDWTGLGRIRVQKLKEA